MKKITKDDELNYVSNLNIIEQRKNELHLHQSIVRVRGIMTANQAKMMNVFVKHANTIVAKDNSQIMFKISINEFVDMMGINYLKRSKESVFDQIYVQLRDMLKIEFEWGTVESRGASVFISDFKVNSKTKEIEYGFSNYIRKYINPISKYLILKDFDLIQSFKSKYSLSLYKHIMNWEKVGKVSFETEDLKDFLGIPKSPSYERSDVIQSKILNPSVSEINERTSLALSYKPIKKIRTIVGYEFRWDTKHI